MTRPKKVILLYARDIDRRSVLSFLLETRGYRVVGGVSESAPSPDAALIVDDPGPSSKDFARLADVMLPNLPMLLLVESTRIADYPVRAWRMPHSTPPIGLLERIRLMVVRKRGPKVVGDREQVTA